MFISDEYKKLNEQAHLMQPKYGAKGGRRSKLILKLAETYIVTKALDYGCGKGDLSRSMPELTWQEYDPAIPGKDKIPHSDEMVVCGDVLEHIEPVYIDNVISHICSLTEKAAVLIISLRQGKRKLPDGSFAHKIVKPAKWWMNKIGLISETHGLNPYILSVDKKELIVIVK
jgi:2-polyprenyl-3-methyl-5-hydroxy-6-metoxy-1,4-benzoquinol methylase